MNESAGTTPTPQPAAAPGRGFLITLGILNILVGFVAMGSPMLAGKAVTLVIGFMLLTSGIFELVQAVQTKGWKIGIGSFVSGALAILGGVVIISCPISAMAILTLVLAFYFIIDGIVRAVAAFNLRPTRGWIWVLFGGIVTAMLGIMIWRGWPVSGLWAVGILVGVRILMSGWTMLLLGLAAGSLAKQAEAR